MFAKIKHLAIVNNSPKVEGEFCATLFGLRSSMSRETVVVWDGYVGLLPKRQEEWIAAVKKILCKGRSGLCRTSPRKLPYLYEQGVWIFGDWDRALHTARFDPEKMRERGVWDEEKNY
jgi:hypothetical protein